jgi:hypothetical protein
MGVIAYHPLILYTLKRIMEVSWHRLPVTRYPDPYNAAKTWLVKRYADRTLYLTQEVAGRQVYPFRRWRKSQLAKTVPGFTA